MPRPVLIDTDAGVDDALALIFALRSPEIAVQTITTVAGNVEVHRCTRNVYAICDFVRPPLRPLIAQGSSRPLKRALVTAPEVHGKDGLGDSDLPHIQFSAHTNAVDEILSFVSRFGSRGTIVALGPLTNIARAIRIAPAVMGALGGIVSMGGAFRVGGNTGPVSEFNYFVDPEAAQIVFDSNTRLTVVPLDVTQQFIVSRKELVDAYLASHRPRNKFILRFTENYMRYHVHTENFFGAYLHDPLAVASLVFPRFAKRLAVGSISVETKGAWTRGMTTCTWAKGANRTTPHSVVAGFQFSSFRKLFFDRLFGT